MHIKSLEWSIFLYIYILANIYLIVLQDEANEILNCLKFGRIKSNQYSDSVRRFAYTLHFYCPRGYQFVRNKFDKHLPVAFVVGFLIAQDFRNQASVLRHCDIYVVWKIKWNQKEKSFIVRYPSTKCIFGVKFSGAMHKKSFWGLFLLEKRTRREEFQSQIRL